MAGEEGENPGEREVVRPGGEETREEKGGGDTDGMDG